MQRDGGRQRNVPKEETFVVQATQPQGDIINGTPKQGHGQPIWQADAEGPNFTREEFHFDEGHDHEPQGLPVLSGMAQEGKQGDGAQRRSTGGGGQCGRITRQTGVGE